MMVHEIKARMWGKEERRLLEKVLDFGYGLDDCEVWNYWQEGYPVRLSDEGVKSLLLRRNGEFLLVLCTWNPRPGTVEATLETGALGVKPHAAANDETGEELRFDGRTVTLSLEGYGVRIVRVK